MRANDPQLRRTLEFRIWTLEKRILFHTQKVVFIKWAKMSRKVYLFKFSVKDVIYKLFENLGGVFNEI